MTANTRRIMVSIPPDLEQGLDSLKREKFYNKPYSEVFRYVFALGLKAAEEKTKKECREAS